MMNLPTSEDDLHAEVVKQLVLATPSWWNAARLTATQSVVEGGDSYEIEIDNADLPADFVCATEGLIAAMRSLALWFEQNSQPWQKVVYNISQQENGQWKFDVAFEYA